MIAHAIADRLGTPAVLDPARRLLTVRFSAPHEVLSWAIVHGGRRRAQAVAWHEVSNRELGPDCDPQALLERALDGADLHDAVGLLTARDLSRFEDLTVRAGELAARCVVTVGLGNALAAGDPPGAMRPVGTINVLCQVSCGLSEEALVEACALTAEARTAAVLQANVPSRRSGRPATGTGTDCIVVAAPAHASIERYAGMHTAIGALIGSAVHGATARGVQGWLEERREC